MANPYISPQGIPSTYPDRRPRPMPQDNPAPADKPPPPETPLAPMLSNTPPPRPSPTGPGEEHFRLGAIPGEQLAHGTKDPMFRP